MFSFLLNCGFLVERAAFVGTGAAVLFDFGFSLESVFSSKHKTKIITHLQNSLRRIIANDGFDQMHLLFLNSINRSINDRCD